MTSRPSAPELALTQKFKTSDRSPIRVSCVVNKFKEGDIVEYFEAQTQSWIRQTLFPWTCTAFWPFPMLMTSSTYNPTFKGIISRCL